MALTDIARKLKEAFPGFGSSEYPEDLKRFREIYGDAEYIRIGEMDYIVINQTYKRQEYADIPQTITPLFYNSIHNTYAIIDVENSSELIDEVYSRVTYMQRICRIDANPDKNEIRRSVTGLLGRDVDLQEIQFRNRKENVENRAKIFQCQLIKDTGVSASPDTYSFMLKDGEINEISESVMRQIKQTGEVNFLQNRDVLEENKFAIQNAVFKKFTGADMEMDIQSVTVKSIFEISLSFANIELILEDIAGGEKRKGAYNTLYLASENNEFAALNTSIHTCNACGHSLIDLKDPTKVFRLHVNTDTRDESGKLYAAGCEHCLTQCPECKGWHFDYGKFIGSEMYDDGKVHLREGRGFIKGLRVADVNYCTCREGIEWVYDELSGTQEEHDVIRIEQMAFFNSANEKIASYEDYCKRRQKFSEITDAQDKRKAALENIQRFKSYLAEKFSMDRKDIKISSDERCVQCDVCGGKYYQNNSGVSYANEYRCSVCDEMLSERRHMITRIDGVIFMNRVVKNKNVISKYVVTKLGNLKKITPKEITVEDKEEPDVTDNAPNNG